jgi:hypothetical protein
MSHIEIQQETPATDHALGFTIHSLKLAGLYFNVSHSRKSVVGQSNSMFTELNWLTVYGLNVGALFDFRSSSVLMRDCVFLNSNFSQAIFLLAGTMGSRLNVFDTAFSQVTGEFAILSEFSTARLTDSFFTDSAVSFESGNVLTRRCTIGTALNLTINAQGPMNTDYCWLGQATWDVSQISFRLSGASIVYVLTCITIFVTYCCLKERMKKRNKEEEDDPGARRSSDASDRDEAEPDADGELPLLDLDGPGEGGKKGDERKKGGDDEKKEKRFQ